MPATNNEIQSIIDSKIWEIWGKTLSRVASLNTLKYLQNNSTSQKCIIAIEGGRLTGSNGRKWLV
jgi:hypothetical protein